MALLGAPLIPRSSISNSKASCKPGGSTSEGLLFSASGICTGSLTARSVDPRNERPMVTVGVASGASPNHPSSKEERRDEVERRGAVIVLSLS
jgi:hypothetical protein